MRLKCNVKQSLREINKNMKWLSKETGISYTHLSDIINERFNYEQVIKFHKIAKALGKSIEEVWEFEEESKDDDSGSTT